MSGSRACRCDMPQKGQGRYVWKGTHWNWIWQTDDLGERFPRKKVENGFNLKSEYQMRRDSRCAEKRKRQGDSHRETERRRSPPAPLNKEGECPAHQGGSQGIEN